MTVRILDFEAVSLVIFRPVLVLVLILRVLVLSTSPYYYVQRGTGLLGRGVQGIATRKTLQTVNTIDEGETRRCDVIADADQSQTENTCSGLKSPSKDDIIVPISRVQNGLRR